MKTRIFKLITLLFIVLLSINAYANTYDFNFVKNNAVISDITSDIIQNDNYISAELNGKLKIDSLAAFKLESLPDINNSDIGTQGFASFYLGNDDIQNSIKLYSIIDDIGFLESKIAIDNNDMAYIKGNYIKQLEKNMFIIASNSNLMYSTGLTGLSYFNENIKFPFELNTNGLGLFEMNFTISNVNYTKNAEDYIADMNCNFTLKFKINKFHLNYYTNFYVLVNPLENVCFCSNKIVLTDYLVCQHNFIVDYTTINKNGHTEYCNKCKWNKIVAHTYTHTYDSIANNQCDCGYNKNANIEIYDSDNKLLYRQKMNTFSKINVNINSIFDSTNYIVDYFDEQEYAPLNYDYSGEEYNWKYIGKVSRLPDNINNLSLRFFLKIKEKPKSQSNVVNGMSNNNGGTGGGGGVGSSLSDLPESIPIEKSLDTLLGEIPATANYQYYSDAAGSLDKHVHGGPSADYYQLDVVGTVPSINWKDSNQNIATVSSINSIVMTQDDDYYYFNIDIDYESQNTPYDYTKMSGSIYQVMNGGTLYLSNNPINKLDYRYSKKIVYIKQFVDKYGYGSNTSFLSQHHYKINDSVSLTINEKQTTQKNTYEEYYKWSNSMTSITDTKTYTKDDSGVSGASNLTKDFYLSYKFPFEDVLYGRTGIANFSRTDYGNINTFAKKQILFTGGQQDFTMPKKPDYDMIISADHNQDNNLSYWNDNIVAKIKIKKSDINNYRYLNLYAPTAVSYNINGTPFAYSEANVSWGTYDIKDKLTISHGVHTYHSVHTQNAIDLLQFTYCDHKWKYEKINEEKHKKVCSKCMWEVEEDHDFKYEYDGINNNLCACGHIKNIKHYYEFSSNDVNDYSEILVASSSYIKPNPVRTGYKHIGWDRYLKYFTNPANPVYDIASTSIVATFVESIEELPDYSDNYSTIFKAKYNPIKYNIRYNNENNLGISINLGLSDLNNCEYGTEYNLATPKIPYYIFKGWTTIMGSEIIDVSLKAKNLTAIEGTTIDLYPIFEYNYYTFKFSNENNLNLLLSNQIADLKCFSFTHYNLPDNIEVTGYTFKGWSLATTSNIVFNPNDEIYNYTDEEEKEITLYPNYRANKYKLHFKTENNKGLEITEVIEDFSCEYNKGYVLPVIKYTNYIFTGWSLNIKDEADYVKNQSYKNITSNDDVIIDLYPVFENNYYIFKFSNENNVNKELSGNIANLKCYPNVKYNLPDNIEVTGYTFKGWSLATTSNIVFNPNDEIYNYTDEEKKEIILYPNYSPNHYTIKYYNDNTLNLEITEVIEDQEFIYDIKQKIRDNIEINGYEFVGWTTQVGSDSVEILPNQEIINYTEIKNTIINFYPVYVPAQFKIIYNTEDGAFSNGEKSITKEYAINTDKEFEMPKISDIEHFNKWGELVISEIAIFSDYQDQDGKKYININEIIQEIINKNIFNATYNLTFYYHRKIERHKTTHSSGGTGGGGGGTGPISNIITDDAIIKKDTEPETIENINEESIQETIHIYKPTKEEKKEEPIIEQKMEEEIINVDETVQGLANSDREKFFLKYGLWVSDKNYETNYHDIRTVQPTKMEVFLMTALKYKRVVVIALFLGLALFGVNIFYEHKKRK